MSTVSKIGDTGEGQNDFTVVTPQLNVNVPESSYSHFDSSKSFVFRRRHDVRFKYH